MEGVLAIIGIFFCPAIMIVLIAWFRNTARIKRYQLQSEMFTKAIEKGEKVPLDLFAEPARPPKRWNSLPLGIIFIAIGASMSLCLWYMGMVFKEADVMPGLNPFDMLAPVGIIPFMIGVAFFIIHFIERKKGCGEKNR